MARPYPIYVAPPEPPAWVSSRPPEQTKEEFLAALSAPTPVVMPKPISIKLKGEDDRPAPSPRVEHRREPVEEPLSASEVYDPFRTFEEKRQIPWKMIAIAAGVVIAVGAFAISRGYSPNPAPVIDTVRNALPKGTSPELPPVGPNVGRLIITSQPSGAKVTIDGKPAGETPLTIDNVKPGRHTIAIASEQGSARRTIRVDAGQVARRRQHVH